MKAYAASHCLKCCLLPLNEAVGSHGITWKRRTEGRKRVEIQLGIGIQNYISPVYFFKQVVSPKKEVLEKICFLCFIISVEKQKSNRN